MEQMAEQPVICEDLVLLDMDCENAEDVIRLLAGKLVDRGWVKEGYMQAVLKRENEYPTGLPTNGTAVAIPHTNAEFCLKSAMVTGILRKAVPFGNMGNPDEKLDVRIVFLLAMKEPAFQVTWLKKLVSMLQKPGMLDTLVKGTLAKDVAILLKEAL